MHHIITIHPFSYFRSNIQVETILFQTTPKNNVTLNTQFQSIFKDDEHNYNYGHRRKPTTKS